jgi:chemotaxis protein CheY-P-specific phosphatase CheC
MFKILKESEIGVVTELIEGGLSMASDAMQNVLQSPITIKRIDYDVEESGNSLQFCTKIDSKVHLLRTELKGDLKGVCYLVLSESEVEKILKACLPPSILEDPSAQNMMMRDGFLTELDNMVAAAVITQFADHLDVMLFGNVPSLIVKKPEEVNHYIKEESKDYHTILHFKAIFDGAELDISPDFIWMVQEDFADKIKSYS